MTYSQYRRARKLVHQCCNYDGGNCLALDDGDTPKKKPLGGGKKKEKKGFAIKRKGGKRSCENACACRAFPAPCCAGGSVMLSCLWMNRWRLLYFVKRSKSGVLSAASHSFPVPTGRNTASPAPPLSTAGKKL